MAVLSWFLQLFSVAILAWRGRNLAKEIIIPLATQCEIEKLYTVSETSKSNTPQRGTEGTNKWLQPGAVHEGNEESPPPQFSWQWAGCTGSAETGRLALMLLPLGAVARSCQGKWWGVGHDTLWLSVCTVPSQTGSWNTSHKCSHWTDTGEDCKVMCLPLLSLEVCFWKYQIYPRFKGQESAKIFLV